MTIDFHAHWLPPPLADALKLRQTPPRIDAKARKLHMPVGPLPFDSSYSDLPARLRQMDAQGVSMQVLSLPCLFGLDSLPLAEALPLLRLFNEATAQAVAQFPGRFAGLASLPFDDIDKAAQEYRHARRALGLLGAIIPANYFTSITQAKTLKPLLDMADQEGGHLFLHPGQCADEVGTTTGSHYPDSAMPRRQLDIQHQMSAAMVTLLWGEVLNKYQGFTLHVANMGGTLPLVVERMDYTSKLRTREPVLPSKRLREGNVMVDCSSMGPFAISAAVKCFGAENILFGSDAPIYRSDWQLEAITHADIAEPEREAILWENGERILQCNV